MLSNWVSILKTYRLIAVIRCDEWQIGKKIAHAVAKGGVRLIEITWNSDQPEKLITMLREELPYCYIGVGTIFDHQDLIKAINAGIQFAFSPHFDSNLLNFAHNHDIPMIPGALSPTEIINAFNGGAKTVKVFPIQAVGGVNYIKAIRAPITHIPLIPTGGVKIQDAENFIKAGALAIGLSTDLFPQELILKENWSLISCRVNEIQKKLKGL